MPVKDLTVSEDNYHLGNSVRGGQWTSQSFKVTFQKDFATKGMRKYQINDKNETTQTSGSTVAPALNAAQLTLWPY